MLVYQPPIHMMFVGIGCYFASLSAHVSQYFSISTAPSALNNASRVAVRPQLMQNFGFLLTSLKDLNVEKTFSILLFLPFIHDHIYALVQELDKT
jgi:hypothetical protein